MPDNEVNEWYLGGGVLLADIIIVCFEKILQEQAVVKQTKKKVKPLPKKVVKKGGNEQSCKLHWFTYISSFTYEEDYECCCPCFNNDNIITSYFFDEASLV
jgi:hypothetical protein